ncbi:MAG: alpha/beta hydrolase [Bacteroidota bacterium]
MSLYKILIALVFLIAAIYFFGPKPESAVYNNDFPKLPSDLSLLADSIDKSEKSRGNIKKDNEAVIVFADDSLKQKTEWSLVYLHGFSASQMEGAPVHREFAKRYGMNLFLARLRDHGIDTSDALLDMTSERMWKSAKEALAVGEKLGDKVILMSTSTGGTLSLILAANFPEKVSALINFSPNIEINDPAAFILNDPWGLKIARLVKGSDYNVTGSETEESAKYWNNKYRLEAIVNLQELVESSMNKKTFKKVACPTLTVAYYKDEDNQDPTVKVEAQEWMSENISTSESKKRFVKLPDVGAHPLASGIYSKDLDSVRETINSFAEEVLELRTK